MYARLVLFTFGPGTRPIADQMTAQFAPALSSMKGHEGTTFFGDDEKGQYGALILWATKEDAEVSSDVLFPKLAEALKPIAKGPVIHDLYEVMGPGA